MLDVVVVGGGFAGVTAARETALRGARTLLVEARDRLGGRTWTAPWSGLDIELGGGWVHWHQPHTWSEIVRAGLEVEVGDETEIAAWYVGDERRTGTIAERDAIAERGWNAFVQGVEDVLPLPHDPLARDRPPGPARRHVDHRADGRARADGRGARRARRRARVARERPARGVGRRQRASLARAVRLQPGAHPVHRRAGDARAGHGRAPRGDRRRSRVRRAARIAGRGRSRSPESGVEVHLRGGEAIAARSAIVALPLNALPSIEFDPPLSEGKQARRSPPGRRRPASRSSSARAARRCSRTRSGPAHPFGYLATEYMLADGEQVMIGFGIDGRACDAADLPSVQRQLDDIIPGYEVVDADRQRLARPTSSRAAPGRSTARAGTRTITRTRAGPRAGSRSQAPTSPTAGRGSSTARSSPGSAVRRWRSTR